MALVVLRLADGHTAHVELPELSARDALKRVKLGQTPFGDDWIETQNGVVRMASVVEATATDDAQGGVAYGP